MTNDHALKKLSKRLLIEIKIIEAQIASEHKSDSGFRSAVAQLVGDCPARLRGRELLKADWIETPLGAMLAVADPYALHLLEFFDRKALPGELSRLRERTCSSISFGRVAPITQIEAELRAYFAARSAAFSTVLARPGSPFTQRVWQELVAIPPGITRSYADIALAIGRPSATSGLSRS
jgi:AraC family transcriptional regulator of adaptative response/methylated-DNA-[protein]-cysteine methyltransferase